MQLRHYYQEGTPPIPGNYYGQDPDAQEDESDLDGQAPPEQQEVAANAATMAKSAIPLMPGPDRSRTYWADYVPPAANAATMAKQPGDGGSYLQPQDDGSAPFPGMPGVTTGGDMMSGPPPAAPSAPVAPVAPQQPNEYQSALKALGKVYDSYPQRKAPNWMERVAAGVLGGAAGYSNAARRAAPIDIGKTTEGILYPGYDSKLAVWQSKVVPAQQAVEIAGQQAAAGWKGQQIAAESALKGAQVDYYEKRGQYYGSLNQSRLVPVTPEIEKASAGFYHVGQQITAAAAAKAYDDYVKSRAPRLLHQGDVLLGPDNQPLYSNAPKAPPVRQNEAQVKDQQLRADFASAVGKDPISVSDAEMNAARRMFGTNDDLTRSSLREFVYKNKRLPNPAEERQITSRAIQERGVANRAPVTAPPAAVSAPVSYTDRTGTLLHFDTQSQLDDYKRRVGE